MKVCSTCREEKPLASFGADASRKDGKRHHCRACVSKRFKKWSGENTEYGARWRDDNRVVCAAHSKKWRSKNPGYAAYYREKNPAKVANAIKMWGKNHRDKRNSSCAGRNAAKLQATPGWTNPVAVGEFYALAAIKTKLTGEPWHVDHNVPLRGKTVCGLHTHYNLQVIRGSENSSKGNRTWPDK